MKFECSSHQAHTAVRESLLLLDTKLHKWKAQTPPANLCVHGSEPGASCQPAEGRDGAPDGAAGEAEAAGQRRPRGSETSHASSETASRAQ